MTLMLVYFVIALGLAIGAGRMSTIVMDAMRVDFTTEMDDSQKKYCYVIHTVVLLLKSSVNKIYRAFLFLKNNIWNLF